MQTNRDLYTFVRDLFPDGLKTPTRSLEEYLRALWALAQNWPDDIIPTGKLAEWFRDAFTSVVPPFDDAWRSIQSDDEGSDYIGRTAWEQRILFQIADLRRMAEADTLENEYRRFGIDSPTGFRWKPERHAGGEAHGSAKGSRKIYANTILPKGYQS